MMRIRLKRPKTALRPKSAVLTRPANKNEVQSLLERRKALQIYPKLIKTDQNGHFYCPTFEIEDFLLACRYAYYCKNIHVIPDRMYDEFEEMYLKLHKEKTPLHRPGSDNAEDYPPHVIALAIYFIFKHTKKFSSKR